MLRTKYTLEYAYSFEELINAASAITKWDAPASFKTLYDAKFTSLDNTYWNSGYGWQLWKKLFQQHYEDIVVISEEPLTTSAQILTSSEYFARKFFMIWEDTKVKYEKLLDLYDEESDNLMKQISATNVNINSYMDTPENATSFIDEDNYTTTISKTTNSTSSDPGTVMMRLDEIKKKFADVMTLWAREFRGLFQTHLNFMEDEEDD